MSTNARSDLLLTGRSPYLWVLSGAFVIFNTAFACIIASSKGSLGAFFGVFAVLGAGSGFGLTAGALSRVDVTQYNVVLTNMFRLVTIDRASIAGLQSASGFYIILKNGRAIIPTAFTPTLGKRSARNSRGRKFAERLANLIDVEPDIDNPKPLAIPNNAVTRQIRWQTPIWMVMGAALSVAFITVMHVLIGT